MSKEGLSIKDNEGVKLSLFADDVTLYIGNLDSTKNLLETVNNEGQKLVRRPEQGKARGGCGTGFGNP